MTTAPRVSVLMSVYNGARYLREAVDSILGQTFGDFEFIIVDDGSTDETPAILDSYGDPRIVRLRNETNIGLTRSLNKGLAVARGEYVARQDADDVSDSSRLAKQTQFLAVMESVAIVGSAHYEIDPNGRVLRLITPPVESSEIHDHLLYQSCFCHGSVLMRLHAVKSVGFYREDVPVTQDRDLWLRLSDRYSLANLSDPVYYLRISADSVSSRRRRLQRKIGVQLTKQAFERRLQMGANYTPSPVAAGAGHFHLALQALAEDDADNARKHLQKAVLVNPSLNNDTDYCMRALVQRAFEMGDWEHIDIRSQQDAFQGLQYVDSLFRILPEQLGSLWSHYNKAIAELHAAYGFATFRASDRGSARQHFCHAWQRNPRFLRNIGMWTTMLRCLLCISS